MVLFHDLSKSVLIEEEFEKYISCCNFIYFKKFNQNIFKILNI